MREIKVPHNFAAYTKGQMAFNDGDDWHDNPYPIEDQENSITNRQEWCLGFQDAWKRSENAYPRNTQ